MFHRIRRSYQKLIVVLGCTLLLYGCSIVVRNRAVYPLNGKEHSLLYYYHHAYYVRFISVINVVAN